MSHEAHLSNPDIMSEAYLSNPDGLSFFQEDFAMKACGGVIIAILIGLIIYYGIFWKPSTYKSDAQRHVDKLNDVYSSVGLDPAVVKEDPCGIGRSPNEKGQCEIGYQSKKIDGMGTCCVIDSELTKANKEFLRNAAKEHMEEDMEGILGAITIYSLAKKIGKGTLKRLLIKKGGKVASQDALKKAGGMLAKKATTVMADEAVEMGACLTIPPPIGEIAAAAEILGFVADMLDVSGFNQYMDNETAILAMRDQLDGRFIDLYTSFVGFEMKPPFCFKLTNIFHGLADYPNETVRTAANQRVSSASKDAKANALALNNTKKVIMNKDLKDIYDIYKEAQSKHQLTAMMAMLKEIPSNTAGEILAALLQGDGIPSQYDDLMDGYVNRDPGDRDREIWLYMKNANKMKARGKDAEGKDRPPVDLGIVRNDGKYVTFKMRISSKTTSGISLNSAGVDLYNRELAKLPSDPNVGPRPNLVYSKYYRDAYKPPEDVDNAVANNQKKAGKKYFLRQRALPVEFATLSFSYKAIKTLCEEGLNQEQMTEHYPIQGLIKGKDSDSWLGRAAMPDVIPPKKYGVKYDKHTGVCEFTSDWCRRMDQGDLVSKTMKCSLSDGGCRGKDYKTCKKSETEKYLEFIFPSTVIGNVNRIAGAIEDFVEDFPVSKVENFVTDTLNPKNWF